MAGISFSFCFFFFVAKQTCYIYLAGDKAGKKRTKDGEKKRLLRLKSRPKSYPGKVKENPLHIPQAVPLVFPKRKEHSLSK